MLLIERLEYDDDDDVSNQKVKVLKMLLIEAVKVLMMMKTED